MNVDSPKHQRQSFNYTYLPEIMKNEDERKHRSKHHHIEKYHRHKIKHHHHHSHDYESLDGAKNNSSSLKYGNLDIINDGLFRIDTRNLGSVSKKKYGTL